MTDLKKLREAVNLRIEKARTPPSEWLNHPDPRFSNAYGWFEQVTNPDTVIALIDRIEELEKHLALALSFAPKGPVSEGLCPMVYHTLDYQSEVELQKRIDEAREALKEET